MLIKLNKKEVAAILNTQDITSLKMFTDLTFGEGGISAKTSRTLFGGSLKVTLTFAKSNLEHPETVQESVKKILTLVLAEADSKYRETLAKITALVPNAEPC